MKNRDFIQLFKTNESKAIDGIKKYNVKLLSIILAFTFIALGHSVGGRKVLKERLNNPFTSWVTLPISFTKLSEANALLDHFEDAELLDSFALQKVQPFNIEFFNFSSQDGGNIQLKVRSVDEGDAILGKILESQNTLFLNDSIPLDCNIILSEQAATYLDIDIANPPKTIKLLASEGLTYRIQLMAIVSELPDLADAILNSHMYVMLSSPLEETNFIEFNASNQLKLAIDTEQCRLTNLRGQIITKLDGLGFGVELVKSENSEYLESGEEVLRVYLDTFIDFNARNNLINSIALTSPSCLARYDDYNCDIGRTLKIEDPYYISFDSKDLNLVPALKNHLKRKYGFELSMNLVEDKKNFALISNLTLLLTTILALFASIAVAIFLSNVLSNHLKTVKSDLGTLKAVGLDNRTLSDIYTQIIGGFYFKSSLFAIILVAVYSVIMYVLKVEAFQGVSVLSLLIWIALFLMVYVISKRTLINALYKTPGDLIYNRD